MTAELLDGRGCLVSESVRVRAGGDRLQPVVHTSEGQSPRRLTVVMVAAKKARRFAGGRGSCYKHRPVLTNVGGRGWRLWCRAQRDQWCRLNRLVAITGHAARAMDIIMAGRACSWLCRCLCFGRG